MKSMMNLTKLFALTLALTLCTLTAAAQNKKRTEIIAEKTANAQMEIMEVTKNDAQAVERGAKRLVPVMIKMKMPQLLDEARGMKLSLVLRTKNTDGSTTNLAEMVTPGDNVKMSLPMPKGVFAESFVLRAKLMDGKKIIAEAVESGAFAKR